MPLRGMHDIARLKQQDRKAFEAFVRAHQGQVFALLSRFLGRGPDVEDLAQETFVRAYNALPRFDATGPAKLSTWLLTIAARLAIDARRRRKLSLAGEEELHAAPGSGGPERDAQRRELGRAIEEAAAALPDDQRMVFLLSDYHGLPQDEIAAIMECPENTVKTRLFRAREKLRAQLQERDTRG